MTIIFYKGWADDLINWSTREFRNPVDPKRLQACWNAVVGLSLQQITARSTATKETT